MTALLVALAILLAFLCGSAFAWAYIAAGAAQEATRANRKDPQP